MSQARDNLATSYTADYGYVTDSPLVGTVTFKESTTTRLTTTKAYDFLSRLRSISSVASGETLPLSHAYAYNNANQRTRMTLIDGSYWVYEYDALGQVKSGKRHWSDGTPVAGQQFEYGNDTIGNRTSTLAGGDENGANLRSASYSANSKNQYTSRGVPPYIEVLGIARADATVTVEGSSSGVYRRGEYFRKELNVSNASAAQYPTIDVDTDVTSPVSGEKFLPLHPESFTHDTDGNLTQDGRWDYVWDGENRLAKIRSRSGSPAPERRIEFEYDWQGRRIRQTVWNDRDDGQGSELSDTLYLYDGWNLIAELNANSSNAKVRTYLWGLDLSGTMEGAGGVGGLLMVIDHTGSTKRHFAAYDGNGNVMGLADSTTGKWSARYEYGPFGEPIRANGDLAYANPIRWSTKYTDNESGLVYYGYRIYYPLTGRWLSRDPAEENGGMNLYSFVDNDPVQHVDVLGQWKADVHLTMTVFWTGEAGFNGRYSWIVANADNGVDGFWSGTSPLPIVGDMSRHLAGTGEETRTTWFNRERQTALDLLEQATQRQDPQLCEAAAQAFGRGLHSLQDRSAHRRHPREVNWPRGRAHPGWWDDWFGEENSGYTISDVYWRRDIHQPPDYYPWATEEPDILAQQQASQDAARRLVIAESAGALTDFADAVRRHCVCRQEMLANP